MFVSSMLFVGIGCKEEAAPAEEEVSEEAVEEETATKEEVETNLAGEEIVVIFPKHEMDTIGIFEEQTREFEELTGIRVELIQTEWDKVADKVIAEMAAGGSAYDVIELDNTWVPKFVRADWIVPIDEFAPEGWKDGLAQGAVSIFSTNNKLYGVPWNNDLRFFIYNKKMLDEAGIEAPPKTFEEMIAQSKILMDAGIAEYGIAGFWSKGWALSNAANAIIYGFGGTLFDDAGNATFNTDPAVAEALDYMNNVLNVEKIADPASMTYTQEDVMNIFISGKTAFMPQAWAGVVAEANNSDNSTVVGQVEVAEWLVAKSPETQATLALPEALAIPSTSKHKEAAWEYIKFITSKEKDKERSLKIGSLPIWAESFSDEELTELYPYWSQLANILDYARAYPKIVWVEEWVNSYEIEIQAALSGEKTTQEALDDLYIDVEDNL